MLKQLFAFKPVAEHGNYLADELNRQYPVALTNAPGKPKVSVDRVTRILERIYSRAQTYRDEQQLGYFKKTRLCHAFKWRLTEIGYSKEFVDMATEGLVVYLAKTTK